jgi:hypothetical protein
MTGTSTQHSRKPYWICLALLILALPLAVIVQSKGAVVRWVETSMLQTPTVPRGETHEYAAASWTLTDLEMLEGTLPKTHVVVAKLNVVINNLEGFKQAVPCKVILQDDLQRQFAPLFLADSDLRARKPEFADKPHCNSLIEETTSGRNVEIVESYLVPENVSGLKILLSMSGAEPQRLVLN